MNTQNWFPLGWTGWISLQSKGLSRVFSNTTVQKHQSLALSLLYGPTLTSTHDYWKSIVILDYQLQLLSHFRDEKVEHRRTDDFELWLLKTLERPLDCKEIKPINPKEISPEYSFWRTDVEAEAPKLRPPDAKNWPSGKGPDARKDWRQEEKGTTEDKMVGWHHQLDEHELEQAPGVGDGQGSLACFSLWVTKSWT